MHRVCATAGCLWAVGCLLTAGCAGRSQVPDLDGASVDPLADGAAPTVLAFVTSECPISNQYLPELQRIERAVATQGVHFWLVYPNQSDTVAKIRAHVAAYGTGMRVLRDPEHRLVKRAGAHVTPEVAVFDRTHTLAYAGRIDDRYAAFGISSSHPHVHDLQDALSAVLAGKHPAPAHTAAVGCSISE
jgi:hypothetical protein